MDENDVGMYSEVASGVTGTSYLKTGLSNGNSYKFRVRARNSIGYSSYSSPFSILAATLPNPPTTFVRDQGSTTKSQVTFSWSAPVSDGGDSIIDYSIEMDSNNSGSYSEVATGVTLTSYT